MFYVDSAGGDDAAEGRAPETPWRSLERVNSAALVPQIQNQIMDLTDSMWNPSFQEVAKGAIRRTNEGGEWFNRVTCEKAATQRHLIQLWGPQISETSDCLLLRMRVRSTLPFKMQGAEIMLNRHPWTVGMQGKADDKVIGPEWQTIEIYLYAHEKADPAHLHLYLGGMIPAGAVFDFSPLGIWRASIDH